MSAVTSDQFRDVIGHFATGVTVITAVDGDQLFGTTASAVSSLSLEPPMLLICMNRQSSTGAAVGRVRRFAVNILSEHQGDLARRFATKSPEKFDGVKLLDGRYGEPLLAEALAHVECQVVEEVSGGSHIVFFGEVHRASAGAGTPLAYYRGEFGRLMLGGEDRGGAGGPAIPAASEGEAEDAVRGLCAAELGAVAISVGRVSAQELDALRALVGSGPEFHARVVALAGSRALTAAHRRLAATAAGSRALQRLDGGQQQVLAAYERGDLPAASAAIRAAYGQTDAPSSP